MNQLFVAWIGFHRRPLSMQTHFSYELKFLPLAFNKRYLRPLEYILKGCITLIILLRNQPEVLWLQLAPPLLLYVAFFYKLLFNRQVFIVADCHNVMLREPWINFPGIKNLLNRCELVLVHNDWVKEQAKALGINNKCLYVLEDMPAILECEIMPERSVFDHPWILFPCSFNADEPIEAVLAAACLLPEITFVITGNRNRAKGIHNLQNVSPNVKLTGFLPKTEFDMLLCTTDAVLGLTLLDGVQVCTANEAVGTGKPLVLSETKLLKQLFYKGAVYVNPYSPESIAEGCQEALLRKEELIQEIMELKAERHQKWLAQANKVDEALKCMNNDLESLK